MSCGHLLILVVFLPYCLSDWAYSQVDDIVLGFNNERNEDSVTYRNVMNSLVDKPRTFNDSLCYAQFQSVSDGVKNQEKWALKVMDSWGHVPPTGIFWGRLIDLGLFDECMLTAHALNDEDNIFVGQYCLASYPLEMIIPDQIERQNNSFADRPAAKSFILRAVCVPDTCNISVLDEIFKESFFNSTGKIIGTSMFTEALCTRNEAHELGKGGVAALAIVFVIGLLVVLSTMYDIMAGYQKKKKNQLLVTFSMTSNAQKLFQMEDKTKSSGSIECLNAIRFISIMWVVIAHSIITVPNSPLLNYIRVWEFFSLLYPMLVINSSFAVDTFLVMSGFLLAYHMLKELDKRSLSFGNILWMYLHRYLRLFPLLGATLLFAVTLHKHIGSGPYWNSVVESVSGKCEQYWWTSLLYIQNYYNPFELCLTHTWYLSVDTQLYLLAPFILMPLHKWGKKFVVVILLLIAASISYVFAVALINKASIRILETIVNALDENKPTIYYSLQGRCSPYLIGILLGYLLHSSKEKQRKLSKEEALAQRYSPFFSKNNPQTTSYTLQIAALAGWALCGFLMSIVIFGPHQAQQPESIPDHVANAFCTCLSRPLWAIAVAWVIYACHEGYASIINSFLSYPLWQFLARLTYAIYLIHPLVQLSWNGEMRVNVFHSTVGSLKTFWGDFGMIVTIAILMVLVFESPAIALEKVLLRGNTRRDNAKVDTTQTVSAQSIDSEDTRKINTRNG